MEALDPAVCENADGRKWPLLAGLRPVRALRRGMRFACSNVRDRPLPDGGGRRISLRLLARSGVNYI